jgi:UDP-N-acetyl-D-mannosaminuronate dehydrogenase
LNFVLGIIEKQIMVKKNPKITLMGLAFKGVPAVLDARDSFAIDVATQIYSKFGLICYGFEPAGTISLPSNSKIKVVDLHEAIYDSDCLIFCHNASFFVDYFFEYSMFIKPSCSLIDMWGQISKLEISNDLEIFAWT